MSGAAVTRLTGTTLTSALCLLFSADAGAQAGDAKALVKKVTEQYRSVETESEKLEVLLVASPDREAFTKEDAQAMVESGGRGITHKRARRKALYPPQSGDKIQIRFSLPAEDEDTGYLVWRGSGSDQDKQWLYMPALRKVRRVPVNSTSTFVGTNLTYEDVRELAGESANRFVYQSAGREVLGDVDCAVVVAKPGPDTSSGYARRKLWIDDKRLITLQVEYFDNRGETVKRLRNTAIHEVAPAVYRAGLTEMRDLVLKESTLLWIPEREVGGKIPGDVFTVDYLENP